MQLTKQSPLYLYTYVSELFIIFIGLFIFGLLKSIHKIVVGSLVSIGFLLFFYRNNLELQREALNKHSFLSPSSNKITNINYTPTNTVISSYLSPFDKHFMIAPCDCTVLEKIYKPQRETDSECMRHICVDTYGNEFYMDQIVSKPLHWGWIPSLLYKRCVSFVEVGTKLKQGERFGLIRFGSNMEYSIPTRFTVKPSLLYKKCPIGTVIANE